MNEVAMDSGGDTDGPLARLKVLVVCAGRGGRRWGDVVVDRLNGDSLVSEVTAVQAPYVRESERVSPWATEVYAQLDRWQWALRGLARRPAATVVPGADAEARRAKLVSDRASALRPDVVIFLGSGTPPADLIANARLGVLEVWDSAGSIGGTSVPWAEALVAGQLIVPVRIISRTGGGAGEPTEVLRSMSTRRSHSPAANAHNLMLRAADLLVDALRRIQREGGVAGPAVRAAATRGSVRDVARSVKRRFLSARTRGTGTWHLAYRRLEGATQHDAFVDQAIEALKDLSSFELISPPPGLMWADPFPIVAGGRVLVFFESQRGAEPGTISVGELTSDGRFSEIGTVLSGPSHMSYPHVFAAGGEWFMIPESAARDEVVLYRAREFPTRWEREATLLSGRPLVDATVFREGGVWWMFASPVGRDVHPFEDLLLFSAPDLTGPWAPHRGNPQVSDVRHARPAGAVVRTSRGLLRPAQDCSVRYGYGLSLRAIERLDGDGYEEREVAHSIPRRKDGPVLGVHTFNLADGVLFIDLLRDGRHRAVT